MPDDPDAALIEKMVAANYGGTPEQALAGIGPFAMDGERDACRRVLAVVREHIAQKMDDEAEVTPCAEDAKVVRGCAALIRADFSYDRAEEIETAREQDERALAEARAQIAALTAALRVEKGKSDDNA